MKLLFWNYIVPVAFVGAVATLIFLLAQSALQRLQLRLRLSSVLIVAALFVLPLPHLARFLPRSAGPVLQQQYERMEPLVQIVNAPIDSPTAPFQDGAVNENGNAESGVTPASSASTVSLYEILPLVWAAGALLILLVSGAKYIKFIWLLRKNSVCISADTVRRLWQKYGCVTNHTVELRVTKMLATPVSLGLFRPCIYVPVAMQNDSSLPYALRHECMHINRHHVTYKLLMQVMCALQWFNPLAWVMQTQVAKACEYACDELVTEKMNAAQRHAYGNVLLACATPQRVPYATNAFGGAAKQMYLRLQAVLSPQKKGAKQRSALLLAVVLVLCAGLFAACAAKDAAQGLSQTQSGLQANVTHTAENTVQVPNLVGKTEAEALKYLEDFKIPYFINYVLVEEEQNAGVVAATSPTAGKPLQLNQAMAHLLVDINYFGQIPQVSDQYGCVVLKVPDIVGKAEQEAMTILEQSKITYEVIYVQDTTGAADGSVVSTNPAAGDLVQIYAADTAGLELYPQKLQMSVVKNTGEVQPAASVETSAPETANGICFPVKEMSYITTRYGSHRGTDIKGERGTEIYAGFSGTVTEAVNHWSWGNTLLIDNGKGETLRYAHCDSLLVKQGDVVKSGQLVATIGSTGTATGNHVHIEYTLDGTLHDPAELFPELNES